jgi:ribosomal protein L17
VNESHLNQICGELNVGQKLRFTQALKEFKKMQELKEIIDESDEEPPAKKIRTSVDFEKPKDLRRDFIHLKTIRLVNLLAQTNQGQILLTKRHAKLASNEQSQLITLLVEGYLEANLALGKQEFVYIADEISKVFVKEIADNYLKTGGGRGRLAEKYYHRLGYYRKCNIFSKKNPANIQNEGKDLFVNLFFNILRAN